MADGLGDDVVAAFKEAFQQFDTDGNGHITDVELKAVMDGLSIKSTHAEVVELIAQVDTDGNGTIEFPEFLTIMAKKMADTDASEMVAIAFGSFDKDGDGAIGKADLLQVMTELGETATEDEVDELIRLADKNADGKLDQQEFTDWMNSK
jgi:calmodulin